MELSGSYVGDLACDFSLFCRDILGVEVQPFHQEWVDLYDGEPRSGIRASRGFGKSTVLGVWYPIWKIRFSGWHGFPWKFCVMSDSLPQSGNIVGTIRRTLEGNQFLRDLVPPPSSSLHYKERKLELTDGSTIYCQPYSRTAVGIHVHRFLFDECTKVADSDLFWNDLIPMVNHYDGHVCMIGTPDHVNDLLEQAEKKPEYKCRTYRAIKEDGSSLWDRKFSLEKLEEIKNREGKMSFMRNYMCTLTASGTQVFDPRDVGAVCDVNQGFEPTYNKGWTYYMGVDLAISQQGDYSVVTTLGYDPSDSKFKIVDITRSRGNDYDLQLKVVKNIFDNYKPVRVMVDDSLFGVPFINDLIHKMYVPAEAYNFQPQKRMAAINNMIRLFPNLIIPTAEPASVQTNELIKELNGFVYGQTKTGLRTYESTTDHDDTVMSLALALFGASDTIIRGETTTSSLDTLSRDDNADPFDEFEFGIGEDLNADDESFNSLEDLI